MLGHEHLLTANTKMNLGTVYDGMGECEKALSMYNEALPILEAKLGHDHPLVTATQSVISELKYAALIFDR